MLTENEIDVILDQLAYLRQLAAALQKDITRRIDTIDEYMRLAEFRAICKGEGRHEN